MPIKSDLTNTRFFRLTVIRLLGHRGKRLLWECLCDCGNITEVTAYLLQSGKTKSCGCWRHESIAIRSTRHGHAKANSPSPTYQCWRNMIVRCTKVEDKSYPRYGGRGITVCDRWLHSFENFLDDMGERPEGKRLARIDTKGNYEKANCSWSTLSEQANNTRTNRWITLDEVTQTLAQWARHLGVSPATLLERLDKWTIEKAITVPRKVMAKSSHPYYGKNWKRIRSTAMRKANGKCERCKTKKAIHIHHKLPVRYFKTPDDANFPENLMAVCRLCHTEEHREMVERFPLLDTLAFQDREQSIPLPQ